MITFDIQAIYGIMLGKNCSVIYKNNISTSTESKVGFARKMISDMMEGVTMDYWRKTGFNLEPFYTRHLYYKGHDGDRKS
jgi:hypothetical protein